MTKSFFKNIELVVFDLDGTLTKSKTNLDLEMSYLICQLLKVKKMAVIGGGSYSQFKKQFLKYLKCSKLLLKNLFILPTSGSAFLKFKKGKWQSVYEIKLTGKEKKKILETLDQSLKEIKFPKPKKIYGKTIEDRGSQITFSALGQKAPLQEKENWHKNNNLMRMKLRDILSQKLPEFEVRMGGLTSIDINKKGIDKAFGVNQLIKEFNLKKDNVVYIGDALFPGGNDEAVFKTKVKTIKVSDYEETKKIIKKVV